MNIFKTIKFWAGILLAQIVLFYFLSYSVWAINCATWLFEAKKYVHQKLFCGIAISLGDVFYTTLILYLLYLIIHLFTKKRRHGTIIRLLKIVNFLYLFYQLFWGLLYFEEPILSKLPKDDITINDAKILAGKYLLLCKQSRSLVKEDRNGVFKTYDTEALKNAVISGQNNIPEYISSKQPTGLVDVKPSIYGSIMSYTGILGYYNPFTAEAQYNPNVPATSLPFTLAHESSHQLGFAREQEASFVAFLSGKTSHNPDLKYSVEFYALKSLLGYIYEEDPKFVKEILHRYSPAMKRDRLYEKTFALSHQGWLDSFFSFTNDLFLKTNQQQGSITYSYFTELLIIYEQSFSKKSHVSQRSSKNTNDEKKFIASLEHCSIKAL